MVDQMPKLEEELLFDLLVKTIIWSTYKGWVQSYRGILPLLINQWANVVHRHVQIVLAHYSRIFYSRKDTQLIAQKKETLEESEK
jgi:prolyl-tRNA synthetase